MNEYVENWLSTLHVPRFDFLDPKKEQIDIRDIIHSLSMLCRFGGHCSKFYSVAEHSVHVAEILEQQGASAITVFAGLLHDAEEAYLPDIPSPIKQHMPEALDIYIRISEAINDKFDLWEANWAHIKNIDKRICITEAKALRLWNENWADPGPALVSKIYCWSPLKSELEFNVAYNEWRI